MIIRPSSNSCPCPADGYTIGTGPLAGVDFIDGYPAEFGEFTANQSDFGYDREASTEAMSLRDGLGLPNAGSEEISMLYSLGSGIRVLPADPEEYTWRPHRLDCGCGIYDCSGSGTEDSVGNTTAFIDCLADNFIDANGNFDPSCDKLELIPRMILEENVGVCDGSVLDGALSNLMTFDTSIDNSVSAFDGMPLSGVFGNFVDDHGIVHSASWNIFGETIDITFITMDPRIPGQQTAEGRVERIGKSLRVLRTGVVTTIRQLVQVLDQGFVILGQSESQEIREFQATYGCGDDPVPGDPFEFHVGCSITDQVEFIGGSTVTQDPEDPTEEFIWWPTVIRDSEGNIIGFQLFGNAYGPLSELSP